MNQEKIIESIKKLETQLEEQNNIITNLKETIELEKELYLSKLNVLESELNLLKNQNLNTSLINTKNDLSIEENMIEKDSDLSLNKEMLYEILDSLDKNDSYYKEVIKNFSEIYVTSPKVQNNETFTTVSSFTPVNAWIESFKSSDKWKSAYKWLLPNAMIGAINISVYKNNLLKEENGVF